MYAPERTETTVAVSSFSTMGDDAGGQISKVLILNADANSALAALLGSLEATFEAPGVFLAANQRDALLDLRKSAFGY